MSKLALAEASQPEEGAHSITETEKPARRFTRKASVLDDRRKLIVEGEFNCASAEALDGDLIPYPGRFYPYQEDQQEIPGARWLQFEHGRFAITKAFYCAQNKQVHITRVVH